MMTRSMILLAYVLMISPLLAQNYPYCAQYDDGSSLDCSFSTLSMCNESVSGVGGICTLNPRGPAPSTGGAGALPFNPTCHRPRYSSSQARLRFQARLAHAIPSSTVPIAQQPEALHRNPSRQSRAFPAILRSAPIRQQHSVRSPSIAMAQIVLRCSGG